MQVDNAERNTRAKTASNARPAAAPASAYSTPPPQYRYRAYAGDYGDSGSEEEEDYGYEDEGYAYDSGEEDEDAYWGNFRDQFPSRGFGFTWDDFRQQRRAHTEAMSQARAEAERKQRQYERDVEAGVNERTARRELGTHETVDYSRELNKTYAKKEYMLADKDFAGLKPFMVQNRHDSTWRAEQLYKRADLDRVATAKFGPEFRRVIQAKRAKRQANAVAKRAAERKAARARAAAASSAGAGASLGVVPAAPRKAKAASQVLVLTTPHKATKAAKAAKDASSSGRAASTSLALMPATPLKAKGSASVALVPAAHRNKRTSKRSWEDSH